MTQTEQSEQTDLGGLKILVFEAVGDGFLLAFAAEGSRDAVTRTLAETARAITALDPWHRRWLPEQRLWWIADDAMTLLARQLPPLAALLTEWHQRPPSADYLRWNAEFGGIGGMDGMDGIGDMGGIPGIGPRRTLYIPPTVALAYRRLGLPAGTPADQVRAARRQLARQHHPDTGGEHLTMTAINSAVDTVLAWLRQRVR
jgi:hypothetical protein